MQRSLSPIQLLVEMAKNQTGKSDIECKFYESASNVLGPKELSSDKKNLMVFDDLLLEGENKCEAYYTSLLHSNVDCFIRRRTILDFRVKLCEKSHTLFACSDKI